MTLSQTSAAVISGVPYLITEVAGRRPVALTDFIGSTVSFTAHRGAGSCIIVGDGVAWGPDVRFNQKAGGAGKDVRVWDISWQTSDHTFQARTTRAI